jgi:tetratricopeptide (TPR) repeat protein
LHAEQIYLQGNDRVIENLGLFDREWGNIQIAQEWSAQLMDVDERAAQLCCEFTERGANCLFFRQTPEQHIVWLNSALQAAQKLGYGMVVANILGKLGLACADLGTFDQAVQLLTLRIQTALRFQDLEGEGEGLGNLSIMYLDRELDDRVAESADLGNLVNVYKALGDVHQAEAYYRADLNLCRDIGDQHALGQALGNLGSFYSVPEKYQDAIAHHRQAILRFDGTGDERSLSIVLGNLG